MKRAVLAIGLRNERQVAALAPRLIGEDGEVVVGGPLTGAPATVATRVTYLASVLRAPGLYDCEVCDDGTIIPSSNPLAEVPEFAADILTKREWRMPQVETRPEPARARRSP